MKISVVIPTFGRRDFLDRALSSLAHQRSAPDHEIVVVDDGADPELGEHVRSLGLDLPVQVEHHAENRGRSAARNSGIARATGEVVVFLDGDMEVLPDFLAGHARAHRDGATVVLGRILTSPDVPRSSFVRYIDTRGVRKVPAGEVIPARYFMTGNSSVAALLLAEAGPFDEAFDEYGGEDTEMGYRLERSGGRFGYAADAVSFHLELNSVPRMARRLRRYGERMLPVLVRKFPRAKRELRLDLTDPIDWSRDGAHVFPKLAARLVCRRSVWGPAAAIGARLPAWLPAAPWFDFVRAASYLDGYRASRQGGA